MWDRLLLVVVVGVVLYAVLLVVAGLVLGDVVFDRLGFGPDDGEIADGSPLASDANRCLIEHWPRA